VLHACATRFDVTENLEKFLNFRVNLTRLYHKSAGSIFSHNFSHDFSDERDANLEEFDTTAWLFASRNGTQPGLNRSKIPARPFQEGTTGSGMHDCHLIGSTQSVFADLAGDLAQASPMMMMMRGARELS